MITDIGLELQKTNSIFKDGVMASIAASIKAAAAEATFYETLQDEDFDIIAKGPEAIADFYKSETDIIFKNPAANKLTEAEQIQIRQLMEQISSYYASIANRQKQIDDVRTKMDQELKELSALGMLDDEIDQLLPEVNASVVASAPAIDPIAPQSGLAKPIEAVTEQQPAIATIPTPKPEPKSTVAEPLENEPPKTTSQKIQDFIEQPYESQAQLAIKIDRDLYKPPLTKRQQKINETYQKTQNYSTLIENLLSSQLADLRGLNISIRQIDSFAQNHPYITANLPKPNFIVMKRTAEEDMADYQARVFNTMNQMMGGRPTISPGIKK